MIEEEHIRFVAAADVTDDCRVEVQLRKRRMSLTASQARHLAGELVRAAGEAESAASELVRPVALSSFDALGGIPTHVVTQVISIAAAHGATVIGAEHLSPDCKAGKHPLHQDEAWDDDADVEVPCGCSCHTAGAAA